MRTAFAVVAGQGGLGFGGDGGSRQPRKGAKAAKQKQAAGIKSGDAKAVQRAVKLVEEQDAQQRRGGGARPVNPAEAARGKVEYVKVKDWGSGEPEELGGLQVESQSGQVFPAGEGGSAGTATPFHEALARRLELLQTSGALGAAQLPGKAALPPFELWAFAAGHYREYLADMHAVHAALEDSLAAAAAAEAAALAAAGDGAAATQHQQLLAALQLFGEEQGLARAAALQQDLQRLGAQQQAQQQREQQQAEQQGGGADLAQPAATQHAAAYAAYIASLARQRQAADGPQEEEQAVLRLLAHAYTLYLMHLTSGGRIAAAAAAKLDLAAADALAFYKDYPNPPQGSGKPLERLVAAANALGEALSGNQQEVLMQELGKAMTKTSMLLVPLARRA